jgi:hypothetical protein
MEGKRPLDNPEILPPKLYRQNGIDYHGYTVEYDSLGRNITEQKARQNKEPWVKVKYGKKNIK